MFAAKKDPGRWIAAVLAVLALALLLWLRGKAVSDGNIPFLDARGPAQWILYPCPPFPGLHQAAGFETTFRRTFVLGTTPANATIAVRGMKSWSLAINGTPVTTTVTNDKNWKEAVTLDVSQKLHVGTNEVVATAHNTNGPPALWLSLVADGASINSDTDWDASLAGAVWQKAALSSTPVMFGKGTLLDGAERPVESLRKCLPVLLLLGVISAALYIGVGKWAAKHWTKQGMTEFVQSRRFCVLAIAVPSLFWVALFFNNFKSLPVDEGFDSVSHLEYIKQIGSTWKLPEANAGWETYQPPLYHFISAVLLSPFHPTGLSDARLGIIRVIGLLAGMAQFTFVFLGLRLLFTGRVGFQCFGLLLAAVIPENLYVSQYISNESLSAALVTVSIYFCLRIVTQERDAMWLYAALGLCFGAALLAKATAVIAAPALATALAGRFVVKRQFDFKVWGAKLGVSFLAVMVVCAWHYFGIWRQFGTPLIGNWDVAIAPAWWMERGYSNLAYFFRFGNFLGYPWFSGFDSFAGGLYSTLWGDGLWGGAMSLYNRPPWNYHLMAADYLLALLPTVLIVIGAGALLWKFIRRPDLGGFLLIGVAGTTLFALAFMALKLPYYAEVKSFYGLLALLPLCVFGAAGWEMVLRAGKITVVVAVAVLGMWATTSYAAFWIQGNGLQTQLNAARVLEMDGHKDQANQIYTTILSRDPHNINARKYLTRNSIGQTDPASIRSTVAAMLADAPDDKECHWMMATVLSGENQPDAAIVEDKKAIQLAPDDPRGYTVLSQLLLKLGRNEDVVSTATDGLRAGPFTPELHYILATAAVSLGRQSDALMHFRLAAELNPKWLEAREQLSICLLKTGQWAEARSGFEAAVKLKPADPDLHYSLALALGAMGDGHEAAGEYRKALQLNANFPQALNNLAWILATDPDAATRNGPEAVQLAMRACELTESRQPGFLITMAAAQAEAGHFSDAVTTAMAATSVAESAGDQQLAASSRQLTEIYKQNRPYHRSARAAGNPQP